MKKLAQKDGITYTKPRYFNDWVPVIMLVMHI